MAWETRRGKLYYYRKQRGLDGRVRSIYFGCGERARAASLEDNIPLPESLATPVAQQPDAVAQQSAAEASTAHLQGSRASARPAPSRVYRSIGCDGYNSSAQPRRRYRT